MNAHDHDPHLDADHDHTRHDGGPVSLPGTPDLGQLRTQAKELRRGVLRGRDEAIETFTRHHPRGRQWADDGPRRPVSLREAQVALARSYGFEGWSALVSAVGRTRVEERDMHRWFGVELNNEVWDLLDDGLGPLSDEDDRDLALYGAYAAARHWREAGTVAHRARAEHLVARAAVAVGLPDVGLRHARRCLDLVVGHPEQMQDWDAPFAHEALGRALAASGDLGRARDHLARARELTAGVAGEEDRAVLEGALARPPWFGADVAEGDLAHELGAPTR